MGEIDEFHHAVDHGIAQGDEGIERPYGKAVDELFNESGHIAPSLGTGRASRNPGIGPPL
jgi:hypothetical protein